LKKKRVKKKKKRVERKEKLVEVRKTDEEKLLREVIVKISSEEIDT